MAGPGFYCMIVRMPCGDGCRVIVCPQCRGLELWGAVGVLPYSPLAPVSSPDVQSGPWPVDCVAAWTANVLRVRGEGCALGSCVCVRGLWDTDSSRRVRPLPLPSALGQPCCPGSLTRDCRRRGSQRRSLPGLGHPQECPIPTHLSSPSG